MIRLNESWTTLLNKFHSDPYGQIKDKRIENWKKLISNLPQINSTKVDLVDEITVQGEWDNKDQKRAEEDLLHLVPWRKGPFTIQDIFIDSYLLEQSILNLVNNAKEALEDSNILSPR